ncbi:MAG: hypothetical protein MJZ25_13135 [Fibrobacter sp.]|nr:hypothetical protein [Fibrobacter sp.]
MTKTDFTYAMAGIVLVFILTVVLLLTAIVETNRRVKRMEKTCEAIMKEQSVANNIITTELEALAENDRNIKEDVTLLSSHVDFFLSGKWK